MIQCSSMNTLSNPYTCYPNYPLSGGYDDLTNYNLEMERLTNSITDMSVDRKTLFVFTIGTPYDEYVDRGHESVEGQWQQLFPKVISDAIFNKIPVVQFIISPSKCMGCGHVLEFIPHTASLMKWKKIDENTYSSQSYDYVVKTFYCPMPSKSTKYDELLTKLDNMERDGRMTREGVSEIKRMIVRQTDYDREQINYFYEHLERLFVRINSYDGYVVCMSFAVFEESTANKRLNNYDLFPEIKSLFSSDWSTSRRLLSRWIFSWERTTMVIFNGTINNNKTFSFVHDDLIDVKKTVEVYSLEEIFTKVVKCDNMCVWTGTETIYEKLTMIASVYDLQVEVFDEDMKHLYKIGDAPEKLYLTSKTDCIENNLFIDGFIVC